jgi:hypothetical protein
VKHSRNAIVKSKARSIWYGARSQLDHINPSKIREHLLGYSFSWDDGDGTGEHRHTPSEKLVLLFCDYAKIIERNDIASADEIRKRVLLLGVYLEEGNALAPTFEVLAMIEIVASVFLRYRKQIDEHFAIDFARRGNAKGGGAHGGGRKAKHTDSAIAAEFDRIRKQYPRYSLSVAEAMAGHELDIGKSTVASARKRAKEASKNR